MVRQCEKVAAFCRAGIIYDDSQPAEFRSGLLDNLKSRVFLAQVGCAHYGTPSQASDFKSYFFELRLSAGGEYDICSVSREC
jgi:hypothetical protein